jgi:hypothetical protein
MQPARRSPRIPRRVAAWVAGWALLLAALAPAITHALQSARGVGWLEVCTARGSQGVQADPATPAQQHTHEHCVFCLLQAGRPALLPAAGPSPGAMADDAPLPGSHAGATRPGLPPWPASQPRAPPSAA